MKQSTIIVIIVAIVALWIVGTFVVAIGDFLFWWTDDLVNWWNQVTGGWLTDLPPAPDITAGGNAMADWWDGAVQSLNDAWGGFNVWIVGVGNSIGKALRLIP